MRVLPEIKKILYERCMKKWEDKTNQNEKQFRFQRKYYLSCKLNGTPGLRKIGNKENIITVRDCMLMDPDVASFVIAENKFKDTNPTEPNKTISTYDGYQFYQIIAPKKGKYSYVECPIQYLDSYSIFIDNKFKDFANLVDKIDDCDANIRLKQQKIIKEFEQAEKNRSSLKLPKNERLIVNKHFCGTYESYYLAPEIDYINKASFLICYAPYKDKDFKVYARTINIESSNQDFKVMYYEGRCRSPNSEALNIHFYPLNNQERKYEFLATFDISDKKIKFNGYLKGIYAGSDPTNGNKPVAGRMILHQIESWNEFIHDKLDDIETLRDIFLNDEKYKPRVLSDDDVFTLFKVRLNKRAHFKDFFTNETRYIENAGIVNKYKTSKEEFLHVVGDYSAYSLDSDGEYINRGILRINSVLQAEFKGFAFGMKDEQIPKSPHAKLYKGWAEMLSHEVLSIIVYSEHEKSEIIHYLLKVNSITAENRNVYINGVRIMTTATHKHKPFAARVVFFREDDFCQDGKKFFDLQPHSLQIPIFPKLPYELEELNLFKSEHPYLLNFLRGFENNLIKSLNPERIQQGFHKNINYGEIYFLLAKKEIVLSSSRKYSIENDRKTLLYLYYAQIHGCNEMNILRNDIKFKVKIKEREFRVFLNPYTLNGKSYININKDSILSKQFMNEEY